MKIFLLTILVLFLITENATAPGKRATILDPKLVQELVDYLKKVLENFRGEMKTGIPELNVPSLDPLPVDDKYFEMAESMATGKLSLTKLFIEGLSTIEPFVHPPVNDQLHIRFELSSVTAHGDYDLDGKVAKIFPLYGKGPFTITVTDPKADVIGRFYSESSRVHFEITDMSFNWDGLHLHLENFLGGGELSAIVQRVIPVFAREIFGRMEPDIVRHMKGPLNSRIDREIGNRDIQNILKMMLNDN